MVRQTLLAFAGWLAAAAVAVAVGVGAVRFIGSGITGGDGDVLSPQQVAEQLAPGAASPLPALTAAPPALPGSLPGSLNQSISERRPFTGPGGTVVAVCVDRQAFLMTWSPAPGYSVERIERGPYEHADVRFEGSAGRSEVRVRCVDGQPTAQWTE